MQNFRHCLRLFVSRFLFLFGFTILFTGIRLVAQDQSLVERMGYPAGTKLLIVHSDDLAVAHAENEASFEVMQKGSGTSASIMAPCPWLPEVAAYAKQHPNHDLGMHLTLTSEWALYKWGPTAPRNWVASLVDSLGYFYSDCADLARHARMNEVEVELRSQIDRAIEAGIQPTHLDSHMGCLFYIDSSYFDIYLHLGRTYRIPVMLSKNMLEQMPPSYRKLLKPSDIIIDFVAIAGPEQYQSGMAAFYENTIRNLGPGVSEIIVHTAYDNYESQGVMYEHPDFGAAWRQADLDFFKSERCKQLLKEQHIVLTTWREIGKLVNK